MRTREELTSPAVVGLSTVSARAESTKRPTRLVVKDVLEVQVGDRIGRGYDEHGATPGQGHRNGQRFLAESQVARRDEPFPCNVGGALKGDSGRLLRPRTVVFELGARLAEDYQVFPQRDSSEYEIGCLFMDAIALELRAGGEREPVPATWAQGQRALLHLVTGSKEDAETVKTFFKDMKLPGLNDPLLVMSDDAPGIIKAIAACPRCLARRIRIPAAKRRCLRIIPNAFGGYAVLKLMFGTLTHAAEHWRSAKITDFERRQMAVVRRELNEEREMQVGTPYQVFKNGGLAKRFTKQRELYQRHGTTEAGRGNERAW
jgi:hypothetical protein